MAIQWLKVVWLFLSFSNYSDVFLVVEPKHFIGQGDLIRFLGSSDAAHKNLRYEFNIASNSELIKYKLNAILKMEELLLNICAFLYCWNYETQFKIFQRDSGDNELDNECHYFHC